MLHAPKRIIIFFSNDSCRHIIRGIHINVRKSISLMSKQPITTHHSGMNLGTLAFLLSKTHISYFFGLVLAQKLRDHKIQSAIYVLILRSGHTKVYSMTLYIGL